MCSILNTLNSFEMEHEEYSVDISANFKTNGQWGNPGLQQSCKCWNIFTGLAILTVLSGCSEWGDSDCGCSEFGEWIRGFT